jgi:hypothetical protein
VEWCEFKSMLGVGFYSQERESGRRPEVGVRRRAASNAGCGGFGSVLARSADGFKVL